VFHVSNTSRPWRRRLQQSTYGGLRTYHCVDGAEYSRLAGWANSFLRDQFQSVLKEFRPQIVHFHNYLSLGDDLVTTARTTGARVVYTLHDYGLMCPNTILLRHDRKLCLKDDSDFFQDCCPTLIRVSRRGYGAAPWFSRAPSLARWRLYAEQYPNPRFRGLLLAAVRLAESCLGPPSGAHVPLKREFFRIHTERIFRDADLFIAPSEFLLRRYVSCGLPPHKIVHVKYGMRFFPRNEPKKASQQIRFGYIGALHAHKGIELLLAAFRGLEGRATLAIHGSVFNSPVSRNYWQRIQADQPSSVTFRGPYENDDVGAILSEIDVVIVPSLWYENAPLTIQEAFISGVPVITADQGGMAEAVRNGIDGLQFRLGDATDLREKMLMFIDHADLLDRLRRGIPEVTTIERHAIDLRVRYEALMQA